MGKRKNRSHGGKSWPLIVLEYASARIGAFMLQCAGRRAIYWLGSVLGWLIYVVDFKHRRLAIRQISDSYPEMSSRQVNKIARQAMDSVVLMGIETVVAPKYIRPDTLEKYIEIIDKEHFLPHLGKSGHGPILVTGHFGNWEIGGYALSCMGFKGAILARPLDNPLLNKYIKSTRENETLKVIDKKGGVRQACRAIKNGHYAGFVADQHAGTKGTMVNFFGRPASTFGSIAMIARRFNSPILICSVLRKNRSFNFEFSIPYIITPEQWQDREDPETWITQEFTLMLEKVIRREPGQYFGWLHNRWRNKPDPPTMN